MIVILGAGPSGLIAANYLKLQGVEFIIIDKTGHGFADNISKEFNFKLGQRTMFYTERMGSFLDEVSNFVFDPHDLSSSIGVYFKGELHRYPVQNNLSKLSISDKMKFYWSYFNRKNTDEKDYANWAYANYGKWFSDNVLLPHTNKTLKEDLYTIDAESYGKKVIKLALLKKPSNLAFSNPDRILEVLRKNVEKNIKQGEVSEINMQNKSMMIGDEDETSLYLYDKLVNTIPILKLMKLIGNHSDVIEVATRSLQYNNMFASVFIMPTSMVNIDKNIVYFPEREFAFSKVNIDRRNGITVIVCESSFRRNDEDKFSCSAYREKFLERIEYDLKKSGLISSDMFVSMQRDYKIISPCYIITDKDYKASNSFLQAHLEHNKIYNLGRFAQWCPWMRVEHALERIDTIYDGL